MTQQQNGLRIFCFYWTNTRTGIKDANGWVHYPIQKQVVIAASERGARSVLKSHDKKIKDEMRQRMKLRPQEEVNKLIRQVFYRDGLIVREFPIRNELCF